jgi:outer membrane protein OmpA-like peptidoglycan-associated protein
MYYLHNPLVPEEKKLPMKKILLINIVLVLTIAGFGQQPAGHYMYLNGGGGMHNISYSLANGKYDNGKGFTINAGYGYFFNSHWGFSAGLGIKSMKAEASLNNFMLGFPSVDSEGTSYEYRNYFSNWKEQQKTLLVDLPVAFQNRIFWRKFTLQTSVGLMVSFPTSSEFKVKEGEITTTGYYSQWNVELKNMPQHGFTTLTSHPEGDISFKTACSAFGELGVLYSLTNTFSLYAGGYYHQGLNNTIDARKKPVYESNGIYNGVLQSPLTDNVKPVAVGVKVGIVWSFGKKAKGIFTEESLYPVFEEDTVDSASVNQNLQKIPEDKLAAKNNYIPSGGETVISDTIAETDYQKAMKLVNELRIQFKLNSDEILDPQPEKIKALADILKNNPNIILVITGHTCNLGSYNYNYKVGLRRAKKVRQMFLKQDVPSTQMEIYSKAFKVPIAPNNSEVNRAKNRRVELDIK